MNAVAISALDVSAPQYGFSLVSFELYPIVGEIRCGLYSGQLFLIFCPCFKRYI